MAISLSGVRIWDGSAAESTRTPQILRIESGRISAIGDDPALARDSRVFHLDGAFAVPGLIDAHVHLTLDPGLTSPREQMAVDADERRRAMEQRAARMLAGGITTARDLGGGDWAELELRDRIGRGEIPGPRLLCAGQPLTSPGGHCHFWGGEARGAAGVAAVVQRQLRHGVDWIKVMATGGLMTRGTDASCAQLEESELRQAVELAREAGRAVAAHCHGSEGIRRAALAGVRTVEHCSFAGAEGFGSDLSPEAVEELAARAGEGLLWVSPTVNAGWARHASVDGVPTAFGRRMTRVFDALREARVPLVASTDAGIPGIPHHGLPAALPVMAQLAGLDPVACLRSATSESARALGLEGETGRLVPGLAADVLVCASDPLVDLGALGRPLLVFARGEVGADLRDERT